MPFITKVNEETVHNICKDLVNKVPGKEIAKKYDISVSLVSQIRCGRLYTEISSQYDIKRAYKNYIVTPTSTIRAICEGLENRMPLSRIARDNNVDISIITRIQRGISFVDIAKDYDFDRYYEKPYLDEVTVQDICNRLDKGHGQTKISKETGISVKAIEAIKYGKTHKNISKDYEFIKARKVK